MVSLYKINSHVATLRYHLGSQQEHTIYEAEVQSLKTWIDLHLTTLLLCLLRLPSLLWLG